MAREAIRSAVTLGSVTFPPRLAFGEASFDTEGVLKIDEKKAPGKDGSRDTLQGRDDSPVTIEVEVHPRDRQLLLEALRTAWRESQDGPVKVVHENAELFGITAVQIKKITSPKRTAKGTYGVTLSGKGWAGAPTGEGCKLLLLIGSTDATTGNEVSRWQTFLTEHGNDPQGVDGIFGTNTDAATRAFQTAEGITVDGIVGPETFGAAGKYGYAPPTPDACKSATKTPTKAKPAKPANEDDWKGTPYRFPEDMEPAQDWVTTGDGVGEP